MHTPQIETEKDRKILVLQRKIAALQERNILLETEVTWYKEQFGLAQKRLYAPSSERSPVGQEEMLFNEAEACASDTVPNTQSEKDIQTYTKRKAGAQKDKLQGLPVEEIHYELPEEERICPQCGTLMHDIGFDTRQEIKIIPAQVILVKLNKHKYACRPCDRNEVSTPMISTPVPNPAFPHSLACASSVAYIMNEKYADGMPLYRLEESLRRINFRMSRQTMSNWVIQGSIWLEQMYRRFHEILLKRDVLFADETPVQVLHEPDRKAEQKSYMWVYRNNDEIYPIVLYEYQETRQGKHPEAFLEGYHGYLHVDGYSGYNGLTGIILVGCWAHARRKFVEALDLLPPMQRKSVNTVARQGLEYCNQLFRIDRDLKSLSPQERKAIRQEKSLPVLLKMNNWLKEGHNLPPKSPSAIAIQYCLNQWEKLTAFMEDGRLELSNNRSERAVKAFIMGRKAWLFSNTPVGAEASATVYSIVETAKANNLNPLKYIEHLLEKLPNIDWKNPDELDKLAPWQDNIQSKFSMKPKHTS